MSQTPAISVVIPVYNMAAYVGQCLDSVLTQNFTNFELIVVNDGSTDNSLDIINTYAQRDKRIHLINKPNGGMACAYNTGQQVARGKYLCFLDSDDWMGPDYLKTMYTIAEREQVDVVKTFAFISEQNGKHWEKRMIPFEKCNKVFTNMLEIPEFVSGHVAQWSCLYRHEFLLKNNIWCPEFPKKLNPDIDYMYHVWAKCKSLYIVPKAFIHYRMDNMNSYKYAGAKMSFYLLQAHLVTRGTMANLVLPKPYWQVKAQVEYQHLLYEFETHRCCEHRLAFIRGLSKIFRENLKHNLVNLKTFPPNHARRYRFIAKAPELYWLNDTLRFWSVSKTLFTNVITLWRFFGLYKCVIDKKEQRIYLFGCLIKKSTLKDKHEEIDSTR